MPGTLSLCAVASAVAQSQPIRYIQDELGRLVAVIDRTRIPAIYQDDALGNLLLVTRQTAGVISILGFSPNGTGRADGHALRHRIQRDPSQNAVTSKVLLG